MYIFTNAPHTTEETGMTYEAAREALTNLNDRIRNNICPKVNTDADVAAYTAWQVKARELAAEGKAAGFIRIFDGSFKLNLKNFEDA